MPIHDWSRLDAGIFRDLHLGWLDGLRAALNRSILPEPYYALPEPVLGGTVPDVLTLRVSEAGASTETPRGLHDDTAERPVAAAATVVVQDLPPADAYLPLARHIVIKSSLRGDEVVAVIEIASRANKANPENRDQFVAKSVEPLRKRVHVLFTDVQPPTALVPGGLHALFCEAFAESPAALPAERPLHAVSYRVLDDGAARSRVVPLRSGDRLPEMPVFLAPHRYVRVPLEETYTTAFCSLRRGFHEALEA